MLGRKGGFLRGRKGIGKLIETEKQIRKLLMRKKRKRNRVDNGM
jgi:hypothetical protein